MYRHILIPSDDSRTGIAAVEQGLALAKVLGAKVTILQTQLPFHTFSLSAEVITETPEQHRQHQREQGEIARRAEQSAREAGLVVQTVQVVQDHLGQAVVQTAKAYGCDLVILPAHDRHGLLGKTTLDTETIKLLTRSRLPVLVLH